MGRIEASWKKRTSKMREPEIPSEPDRVACKVCFKEIPLSEAVNEEATDYILHFCGLDCYAKWKDREKGYGSGNSPEKNYRPERQKRIFCSGIDALRNCGLPLSLFMRARFIVD